MHLGMVECRVPFTGHCDLNFYLWPRFWNNRVWSISLIIFEVGISNLVCGCILGWQSVAYHNWVTVTLYLTSDLVSRSCIESSAYLLFFEIWILNSMCKCVLGWRSVTYHFFGNCDLDLWPSFKNYYVRSISLILYEIGIPNLMWMHLGMMECHVPFMGHYDVDLWPRF